MKFETATVPRFCFSHFQLCSLFLRHVAFSETRALRLGLFNGGTPRISTPNIAVTAAPSGLERSNSMIILFRSAPLSK